ncbi:radical SAM protein [Yanshouia hominis]|uniref:Radical SAM protein n=1 Tax=Yanshouia hominis TaxID=2763673 RepID=A0ABR7NG56_9FIRM|nr:radical SAM protein [Yanshouia hominis]MBC8575389.1 radical SAM protein [Yanshouia hominis]
MERLLEHCTLCPRRCGVNRAAGERGRCGAGKAVRVARAALHPWEEPCISGSRGSGTVFFSHCALGCVFCQNAPLSREGAGLEIGTGRLGEIFLELQAQGAHNINLVTPTHYVPQILEAAALARADGLRIPFVYNCGGYELPETVALLDGTVDLWLPDFKYAQSRPAARYSAAADYPERALEAIEAMVRQTGAPCFGPDGLLQKGVLVRHLLLPGLLADSMRAVELLAERFEGRILLSLMSQFTPMPACSARFPELSRPVNPRHYEALVEFTASLGAFDCYTQEPSAADGAFIPSFLGQGVLAAGTPGKADT